ncbi:MAG: PaaI family thioesterase [Thiovulaceae bacterium]|nr:PaaI family thioesterase [Sulfurimonadaceae bacterium]
MDQQTELFLKKINAKLGENPFGIKIPPPVFTLMEGVLISFDPKKQFVQIKFPVKEAFQNPYGSMQGGMIATAIDNTIGPISMFHKNPNVTQRLEIDYKKMITPDLDFIYVDAWYVSEEGRSIYYEAKVHDEEGEVFTTAKAYHRMIKL